MIAALRQAGVPVALQGVERFAAAIDVLRPTARTDLYWMTRIAVLPDITHLETFDRLFDVVFEGGSIPVGRDARKSQREQPPADGDTHHKLKRNAAAPEAVGGIQWTTRPSIADEDAPPSDDDAIELPELLPAALSDVADQPFDQLHDGDLRRIGQWLEEVIVSWPLRRARRCRPHPRRGAVDTRRTLAAARRTGGDPVRLIRKAPIQRPRRVVMLADVSGSMQTFVRPYLHVMRALASSADAEVYAFATNLTRITPALSKRDPGDAVEAASALVDDRFSGTRIATSLQQLLTHPMWATSIRGAVVLIASDGWDTDPPDELSRRMARLQRHAERVVWVNPRVAADGYEPLVGGIAAALPHCDTMLSGHSLLAMRDVLVALAQR